MEHHNFDSLMAEVGALDEEIVSCVKTSEGEYAIQFPDGDVLVEWDERSGRLIMSMEIGTPPAARAARIHEIMLNYNFLSRETGGLRMALTGREGTVVQIVDFPTSEIE